MLRAAGIRVDGPVLEAAARQLIAMFQAKLLGHCYLTAKWAETADRKIAGPRGARRQISGPSATRLVHLLRARSNAMMVGVNTVLNDDPLLTSRDVSIASHLDHTIVLDTRLRTPVTARLFQRASDGDVVIYCSTAAPVERKVRLSKDARAIVQPVPAEASGHVSITEILRDCGTMHILAEPGPTLAKSLIDAGVLDRLWVIRSQTVMNDPTAPLAAEIPTTFVKTGELDVGGDTLTEYLNSRSPVFFAPEQSADFVLARDALATSSSP
jgi:diaminohydroxyphosphoribosylaminopyrimidine deaminase/5-amino-6-(5-phosphoribosylamino)uracil reductase